jgi:hypothetical protein
VISFSHEGVVWVLTLDEPETQALSGLISAGGPLAPAAGPLAPAVAAAVAAGAAYIVTIDKLGGNHGVEINGVIGVPGIIVTPRAGGLYAQLVQAGRMAVSGKTIIDFVIGASGHIAPLGGALGFSAVGGVLGQVVGGTPLGWALAGALGLVVNKLLPPPDPNQHGGVHADRTSVGDWERFMLAQLGNGNQVSLLSWQGLFSAQGGGGGDVYANRPQVGSWETWDLIDNHDGSISFKSNNGHYLTALNGGGGGSYCRADRTAIGTWERFIIENQPNGRVALKTHDKGTYLSVQPGK